MTKDKSNTIPIYRLVAHLAWTFNEVQMQDLPEDPTEAVSQELETLIEWAESWEEVDDAPAPGQVAQSGNITILPSPVQQEPSALEVALRMMAMDSGLHWEHAVADAWAMVDKSRAEEARRDGK